MYLVCEFSLLAPDLAIVLLLLLSILLPSSCRFIPWGTSFVILIYSNQVNFWKSNACSKIACDVICTTYKIIASREPVIYLHKDKNYETYSLVYNLSHRCEANVSC